MTRILRIDSSARPGNGGSRSRELADQIVKNLKAQEPDAEVVIRDLAIAPLPHISNETIAGFYTPPEQLTDDLRAALSLSDELISELKSADTIVISAPIYNFSVPSALKAWVDHVVRINQTFSYEDGQFGGLVADRPVYVAYAYGAVGYAKGGPLESYDFMRPYLTLLLNFIGLTSVTSFSVEGTTADDAAVSASAVEALAQVDAQFAA
ncbi:NAD(P)H-dependent oxidoreductase [Pseudovibrio exalbescens]|uniref:FMN-dependent NADH-azoreductase n=1 Tax=Pseudovibrio exalbescens TaxID=197461 RepID=UPI002365670C|nr:NAD(P)H-dependent oxidoreductase [Pseudovibrio exalbescens]MDD7908335.1 NAD(P)H-dependent oxidoreductase [Pseudovibrio exalbescens]